MGDNDAPKGPAPVSLRITADAAAALDALSAATGGAIPRHRLMVAAMTHGARALAASPAELLPLLGMGPLLAAARAPVAPAAVSHPTTPVSPPATPVAARSARVMPPSPPVARAPRAAAVTSSAPSSSPRPSSGPRGDAPPEAVEVLRAALRAAVARGASVNALAGAAGMTGGGTRRRLAALLAGESPPVSVQLARAVTAAAEEHGRGG